MCSQSSAMRRSADDCVDAVCSVLALPLTLPAAVLIGACAVTPMKRDAVCRFFETGPWGTMFDRLTWLPWSSLAAEPRCLYFNVSGPDLRHFPSESSFKFSKLPPCLDGHRRIVMVSDTHGKHGLLRLPAGDILLHAGDILSRNACARQNNGISHSKARAALRDFNRWLGTLPYKSKVVIGGNHDATLEALGTEQAQQLLSNAIYLQDSSARVEGLVIYGTPWSNGRSANRAFQSPLPPMPKLADGLAESDVLMSHAYDDKLLSATNPSLYVSGHDHGRHGLLKHTSGRIAVNASICDSLYRPVQLPIVCDLAPKVPKRPTT
mmetsp:Transcript_27763/g.70818  ORF Transcript_27763/g.70818 Transcript_27763/m.70818 type:complete len:322 (-) Transcript_27763:223-1188(-)